MLKSEADYEILKWKNRRMSIIKGAICVYVKMYIGFKEHGKTALQTDTLIIGMMTQRHTYSFERHTLADMEGQTEIE